MPSATESYPSELKVYLGGYYTLGRAFVLIGKPSVMKACTTYGLPHKTLMRFVLKLMANLTDSRDGTPWTRSSITGPDCSSRMRHAARPRCPRVPVHRGEGAAR